MTNAYAAWRLREVDSATERKGLALSDPSRRVRITMPPLPHVASVPALAALWDDASNAGILADEVTVGSSAKRWWRCPHGPDHAWDASVQSVHSAVTAGRRGCPYCRGLRPSVTNRLDVLHPWLAQQWHPKRNRDLQPQDVVAGSSVNRWWLCPMAPDHEWEASPQHRAKASPGAGCPFCRNLRPSVTNRLDVLHPDVAGQWHPTRNGDLRPEQVVASTHDKYWWQCPVGPDHEWRSQTNLRTSKGHGCPACGNRQLSVTNTVAARYPQWLHLWHPNRNSLRPDQTITSTEVQVWWKCPNGPDHEWDEAAGRIAVNSWANGRTGCPCCSGIQASVTNSVASVPHLAAEWHPTANGALSAADVVAGTSKKRWWLCSRCGHEWQATGSNRLRSRGCPMCKTFLRSTLEICLGFELRTLFADLDLDRDKVVLDGRIRHVDLLIESARLIVELDGRYHHADRDEHDAGKSELLRAHGWHVVRVREQPLTATHVDDVVVPVDAPAKVVANAVVEKLNRRGWIAAADAQTYLDEFEPRRLAEALGEVARRRPGKKIVVPGTPRGPSRQDRWEQTYVLLCVFVGRERHAVVPEVHVEAGVRLGAWVSQQRARYRGGQLDTGREARLEALPGWSWDPFGDAWEVGYRHLLAFLDREGHVRVPAHHVEANGYSLGTWVRSHRRVGGGRRLMTPEQALRLETVPGWTYDSPHDVFWERALASLMAFAEQAGHCRTPRGLDTDGIELDGWAGLQRVLYHDGRLPPERAARLESVPGWSWRPRQRAWDDGYAALQRYTQREGHALVPRDHLEDSYPLGAWVGEQRNRRHDIDPVRRARLVAVRGWSFDPHSDTWERHFAALRTFVEQEGHAGVPTEYATDGLNLGSWVIRHRLEYKNGKVPAERAARLEQLPGWMWDARDARWQVHLQALGTFVTREGHARVPSDHVEGDVKLGAWVVATRSRRKSGAIDNDRASRLELFPGWAWDARQAAWEQGFAALLRFAARTGGADVPGRHVEADVPLGQWLGVQRQWHRTGRLRADRAERLAAVPGALPAQGLTTLF